MISSPASSAAPVAISAEMLALQRTRNALRADAARVSDTLKELVASDERFLSHAEKSGDAYDQQLAAAAQQVQKIARRERLDNQILWWSFAIFFVVVGYIWSQRLIRFAF